MDIRSAIKSGFIRSSSLRYVDFVVCNGVHLILWTRKNFDCIIQEEFLALLLLSLRIKDADFWAG